MNPYEKCPEFEGENYLLRLVKAEDLAGLLKVYSDEKAVPLFNSDNCHGETFHYTTEALMKNSIDYWLTESNQHGFVRWTIFSKKANEAVGTIELFHREAQDYFTNCGLLRLDLRSDYEIEEQIFEILSLILSPTYEMFDCDKIATKIPLSASERKVAALRLGFSASNEKLIGHDGTKYGDYYVLGKD